jgi:antitoxin HicB
MVQGRKMKTLAEYLALPYTVVLRKDEDGDFVGRVDELPGCIAHGPTRGEALELLEEVQREWIADALERGHQVPEPALTDELPSGKWVQRVPRSLHARLAKVAEQEGVSLNHLVTSMLAEALGTAAIRARPEREIESANRTYFVEFSHGDFYAVPRPALQSPSNVTSPVRRKGKN